MNKKAQSEMVGFGLIIILVSIVLVIFLSVSFRNSGEETQSFEVESYLQSIMDYTTECAEDYPTDYYNVRRLIFACLDEKKCLDDSSSCEVLEKTLQDLIDSSWKVGEMYPNKGYSFKIKVKDEELLSLENGNKTNNNRGAFQSFEEGLDVQFIAYN